MAVKEQDRKAEPRTVATRRATAGVPQRMHKRQDIDESAAAAPSLAELQQRQRSKGLKRRPTRDYNEPEPNEVDEDSIPDVPPTTCD
ncbi:MAG TPA: hypothetical protein VGQ36_23580 [Thermoanaerobaculia bacterium]|jgi:hypothetical protein|nr:hypothetical protein [Thermoanaerobaculia bacterium]